MATCPDDARASELKHMVMSFRVSELQVLLGSAGRNKSGRKHDLLSRALQLLKNGCTEQLEDCVRELYERRFPQSKPIPTIFGRPKHKQKFEYIPTKMPKHIPMKPCKPPVHPNVTFKGLPFYDVLSEILKPCSLTAKQYRDYTRADFSFALSEEQVTKIFESKASDTVPRYQVQVQIRFCLLETTCEQKDCLPNNLSVQVNRQSVNLPAYIPPSKAGIDPKRINKPVDITPYCNLCAASHNRMEVSWLGDPSRNFAVTVNLVKPLSSEQLLGRLRKKGVRSSGHSQALINEKLARDPDSEIATTSLKVSLLCPLGKMRMVVPARPATCTHMQCFDVMLFLQMNERKPSWICPVCDKPAEFANLFIDGLFVDILNNTESEEIIFLDDGRWEAFCPKKEYLNLSNSSGSKSDLIALDLSNSPKSSPSKNDSKKNDDIIDLTGDSTDEEDSSDSLITQKRKDNDHDEIHSLSSTSPYRSDNSIHRDDSLAPPPAKQRRTPHDDLTWEVARDLSYNSVISNALSSANSSPRHYNFAPYGMGVERTPQPVRTHLGNHYSQTSRNASPFYTTFPSMDHYPSLDRINFFDLSAYDPMPPYPAEHLTRTSPYLNQQPHLPSTSEPHQMSLPSNAFYVPPDSDVLTID